MSVVWCDMSSRCRYLDKYNVVKYHDSLDLWKFVLTRYHFRSRGMVIVELGSSTGRATNQLAKWFPEAQVLAIESEPELVDYARKQQTSLANLTFVQGSVFDENLLVHLKRNLNLQSNFADLVLSTHVLHLDDPQIELAFANIAALLKPNGSLYTKLSLWSEVFELGKANCERMFAEECQSSQFLYQLYRPDWRDQVDRLRKLLTVNQFGSSPEVVTVTSQIKILSLQWIQACLKCIFPLSESVPEKKRLEFYSEFFEQVYEDYFVPRGSLNTFVYQYLQVCASKKVSAFR